MEYWEKNGVQTMIVQYPNLCYNGLCCSEVQVYMQNRVFLFLYSIKLKGNAKSLMCI